MRAGWRVFSTKPGAYGAGLQELIDAQAWQDDADLVERVPEHRAATLTRRSGDGDRGARHLRRAPREYRCRAAEPGQPRARPARFERLLPVPGRHGRGGAASVGRATARRTTPTTAIRPRRASARCNEEIARVIRSRVVNPKWIDGVKRHGYKGASEIAATVDYLFGYDATARVVSDHQYALVTDAYVNDADTREFMQRHNPHALHSICERLTRSDAARLVAEPRRLSGASRTASAAMRNSNSKANELERHCHFPGISLRRAGRPGAVAAGASARRDRSRIWAACS